MSLHVAVHWFWIGFKSSYVSIPAGDITIPSLHGIIKVCMLYFIKKITINGHEYVNM